MKKIISDIKKFTDDFKSKYGLESDGSCYTVKEDFYLEIISSYEEDKSPDPLYLKPIWTKIKASDGDLISSTTQGCFIELKGSEGFVECRPESISKESEPQFDRFNKEYLEKLGKNMITSKPMTFEERKKVIITRA